jgi:hypothetical protein
MQLNQGDAMRGLFQAAKGKTEVARFAQFAFFKRFSQVKTKLKWYPSGIVPKKILRLSARASCRTARKN